MTMLIKYVYHLATQRLGHMIQMDNAWMFNLYAELEHRKSLVVHDSLPRHPKPDEDMTKIPYHTLIWKVIYSPYVAYIKAIPLKIFSSIILKVTENKERLR